MPKIVDNYVLERKIGGGQFGEVFKGYNRVTNQDIAVKVVRRSTLKGKFKELLENEIKILRTCNNENIIKLYDLKKTQTNFYLILEYCNEGDLMQYLKKKKILTEDEAVEYFIQLLNAFKTLVRSNIMHRDLKLPNILKHNGMAKLADFGFARLVENDWANTQLGSPLNMAPEILDGKKYNSKADIWSIGTVFYELLFGKPPFTAQNIIQLRQNINKKLEFPRRINKISKEVEDVLSKMLVVDVNKRIEWPDLFDHPIVHLKEEKLKNELHCTLQQEQLALGMSKFYIKNNMVIEHPNEIQQKQAINQYTIDVAQKGKKAAVDYKGAYFERKTERDKEQQIESAKFETKTNEVSDAESDLPHEETEREKYIKICKKNSNRILHERFFKIFIFNNCYRNIYVFLASVAEDAMNNFGDYQLSQIVGFLLVKQLLILIDNLKGNLMYKNNVFGLQSWSQYVETKDFQDILQYIIKEFDVFNVYFQQLYEKLITSIKSGKQQVSEEYLSVINENFKQDVNKVLKSALTKYIKSLIQSLLKNPKKSNNDQLVVGWIHIDRILDCLRVDQVFQFEDKEGNQFNFKIYYELPNNYEYEQLVQLVQTKLFEAKIIL